MAQCRIVLRRIATEVRSFPRRTQAGSQCGTDVQRAQGKYKSVDDMTTSFRFLFGLACALCGMSSTMAAGPKSDESYADDFKGWEVVCDNVKRCVAEGVDRRVALHSAGALLFAVAAFLSALPEGWAMGVFSRLVLFSEVHGTVLKEGKPVAGAELVQKVVWSDDEDKNPTQHTIQQTIMIRYQGSGVRSVAARQGLL